MANNLSWKNVIDFVNASDDEEYSEIESEFSESEESSSESDRESCKGDFTDAADITLAVPDEEVVLSGVESECDADNDDNNNDHNNVSVGAGDSSVTDTGGTSGVSTRRGASGRVRRVNADHGRGQGQGRGRARGQGRGQGRGRGQGQVHGHNVVPAANPGKKKDNVLLWKDLQTEFHNPNSDTNYCEVSGPRRCVANSESPVELFKELLTQTVLQKIVEETNRYHDQIKVDDQKWKKVTDDEILAFIGVLAKNLFVKSVSNDFTPRSNF